MISAFIVCIIESLLIFNMGRLINFITGYESEDFAAVGLHTSSAVFVYIITAVALFAVIFYMLERRSIAYITKISKGVKEISKGNLNSRIEVAGDDEFSEMAENINKMSEDLKKLLELEREAEQSKTELITNIAHDLKTPLTSIIGYLELLSRDGGPKLSDELRQKYLQIAFNKAKRLEQLIEDLFSFTKLSYGKITMKVSYVDVVKLLEQLLEEAYPNFVERGLSYEIKSNVSSLEITADGNLIARLFDNLIGNAIKYGADGKRVIVRVNADIEQDIVEVQVINFGYIIPEKDMPFIFNKFYRVDQARSTQTGGSGLGLAIVKDIVNMHGGSISVSSDLNGTIFTVRLKIHFDKNNENFIRA
ncbi:MAG: HAMP domain-containing sensor histidine kinase [Eubacteriales bacterium]|nr:HAMP domain-containing sensor histidine kinase [Eubacteriales bacterium]